MFNNTVCAEIFHRMSIDVPAGVGAPPLDTQLVKNSITHATWLSYKNVGQTAALVIH